MMPEVAADDATEVAKAREAMVARIKTDLRQWAHTIQAQLPGQRL